MYSECSWLFLHDFQALQPCVHYHNAVPTSNYYRHDFTKLFSGGLNPILLYYFQNRLISRQLCYDITCPYGIFYQKNFHRKCKHLKNSVRKSTSMKMIHVNLCILSDKNVISGTLSDYLKRRYLMLVICIPVYPGSVLKISWSWK